MATEETIEPAALDTTPVDTPAAPPSDTPSDHTSSDTWESDMKAIWENSQADGDDGDDEPQGQPRDEHGRFKAADADEEPDETGQDRTEPDETGSEADDETPDEQAIDAPRAWNEQQRQAWEAMPADAKRIVAERENELHELKSHFGRIQQTYGPVDEVFGRYSQYLDQVSQGDLGGYLERVLSTSMELDTNPESAIRKIAEMYKVDLSGGQPQYSDDDLFQDPKVVELERKLAATEQRIQAFEAQQSRAAQDAARSQEQKMQRVVEDFFKAHPDASQIESDIAAEIIALRNTRPELSPNETIQLAYDRAAWANETTRAARLKAQSEESAKAKADQARDKASRAKRAASINVNSAGKPNGQGATSWRDEMQAVYRRMNS